MLYSTNLILRMQVFNVLGHYCAFEEIYDVVELWNIDIIMKSDDAAPSSFSSIITT